MAPTIETHRAEQTPYDIAMSYLVEPYQQGKISESRMKALLSTIHRETEIPAPPRKDAIDKIAEIIRELDQDNTDMDSAITEIRWIVEEAKDK